MEILATLTDIGNVNTISVTYRENPCNGFDTLRNKTMQSIFQYVTQQPVLAVRIYTLVQLLC